MGGDINGDIEVAIIGIDFYSWDLANILYCPINSS